MRVELELLPLGDLLIDLGELKPSKVLSLLPRETEKLTLIVAGHQTELGELFKVTHSECGRDELVLRGATGRIISAGRWMEAGRLVIDGEAGPFTGTEMSGGELEVFGNAGECLGVAMQGGLLRVHGRAGDWCGSALPGQVHGMNGGTILVDGDVGDEAGAGMRRGLLIIGGDSGKYPGERMLAGTIFCLGRLGAGAGLEMKRGSLVAGSSGALLPGFYPAGEADSEWLRIYLVWLQRFELPGLQVWNQQQPYRYTGDHLVTGKGEVLVHEILE
jgi:formylmethanofuran dehydrogenase subunit C